MCFLQQIDLAHAKLFQPEIFGHIFENFVATELIKQISVHENRIRLYHFRTSDNKEVDFVLETHDGKLVGIEVKSRDTVTATDFKGLKVLHDQTNNNFVCGIVLYCGLQTVPFGDKLWAIPVAAMWG